MVFLPVAGFGSVTNPLCNTVTSADYCPDCHKVDVRHYHCKNWECPVCYPWTAARAGKRAADRLNGAFWAWRSIGKHPGNMNHFMLSVPASEYVGFDPGKGRTKAVALAKQIGVSGGSIVYHERRIKKEFKRLIGDAMRALGLEGGLWAGVHADVLRLPSVDDYTVFSPHYHIVGFFRLKEKSNEFFKRTGWTYKNISWAKRHRVESKEDVKKIVTYQLTHHAVSVGKHAVTYFGTASYNKVTKKTYKEKQLKTCLRCSGQMYQVPVWSERQLIEMKAGEYRYTVDEDSIRSRLVTVHTYYTVRTSQALIDKSLDCSPPVC